MPRFRVPASKIYRNGRLLVGGQIIEIPASEKTISRTLIPLDAAGWEFYEKIHGAKETKAHAERLRAPPMPLKRKTARLAPPSDAVRKELEREDESGVDPAAQLDLPG